MFASTLRFVAVAMIATVLTAPASLASTSTHLTPEQVSRLGARTEASGYAAITRYLVRQANESASPAPTAALGAETEAKGFLALERGAMASASAPDVARLGAQTEAKGYRALVRYRQQVAATPEPVDNPSGFAWSDALAGAGLTAGVFLLGAAAALALRKRNLATRPRR